MESPLAQVIANTLRRFRKHIKSINYLNKHEFYMRVAQGLKDSDEFHSTDANGIRRRMLLEAQKVLFERVDQEAQKVSKTDKKSKV